MNNVNRDKIIELLKTIQNMRIMRKSVDECADYLIANGAILPPCKVGDTVYLIKDGFIEPCEVEGIHYTRRGDYVRIRPFYQEYIGNWSVYYKPSIRSFGKTVFLDRKDAENKIKKDD